MARIVIDRIVPCRAVIPDRNCARFPFEAALIVFKQCGIEQLLQQRHAFLAGLADKIDRKTAVDIEHLLARLRMADDDGMHCARLQILPAQMLAHICLGIKAAFLINMIGGVIGFQPLNGRLQLV